MKILRFCYKSELKIMFSSVLNRKMIGVGRNMMDCLKHFCDTYVNLYLFLFKQPYMKV